MTTEETQSRQGTMEQQAPMTHGTPRNVSTQQTQGIPVQSSVMKKEAKQASDELKRLSQEYQRRGLENIDTATVMKSYIELVNLPGRIQEPLTKTIPALGMCLVMSLT